MNLYKTRLNELLHKKINIIGATANMVWMGIGNIIEVVDRKGNLTKKSYLSIHIQCPWRIVNKQKNKVLLSSFDLYNKNLNDDNDTSDISKCFKKKCCEWLTSDGDKIIIDYSINLLGDLKLFLSDGEVIELLIDTCEDAECWRIFKTNSGEEHLVMKGLGIEYE